MKTKPRTFLAAALCAVGLSSFAAEPEAVQLWAGGPYWATVNVGTAEAGKPAEYGALYNFADAATEVAKLGEGWRLPTKADFENLLKAENCKLESTQKDGANGILFTSQSDSSKSIFLPAAGNGYDSGDGYYRSDDEYSGYYWSSTEDSSESAWHLYYKVSDCAVNTGDRNNGMSVRVVRDTPLVSGPTVTVGEVTAGEPWSTITVNYTLGGTDATLNYKVAFDITAGGQTASVTNDAAKLTDGAATKEIDTAALFGKEIIDTKAKVKVTLIAIKPKAELGGVQLWEGGPFFAECNVGASKPEESGYYFWWGDTVGYTHDGTKWVSTKDGTTSISFFNCVPANTLHNKDAAALADYVDANGNLKPDYDAATAHLGAPWRMMTGDEVAALVDNCDAEWTDNWNNTGVNGRIVKGRGAYSGNSIFLPAASYVYDSTLGSFGSNGDYWSSTPRTEKSYNGNAVALSFNSSVFIERTNIRFGGQPVRAVRGSAK